MEPTRERAERQLNEARALLAKRTQALEEEDQRIAGLRADLARIDELREVTNPDIVRMENTRRKLKEREADREQIAAGVQASHAEVTAAERDLARVRVVELKSQIEDAKARIGATVVAAEMGIRAQVAELCQLETLLNRTIPAEDRRQRTQAELRIGADYTPKAGAPWTDAPLPPDGVGERFFQWLARICVRAHLDYEQDRVEGSPPVNP